MAYMERLGKLPPEQADPRSIPDAFHPVARPAHAASLGAAGSQKLQVD